jgi:hypothetical protein
MEPFGRRRPRLYGPVHRAGGEISASQQVNSGSRLCRTAGDHAPIGCTVVPVKPQDPGPHGRHASPETRAPRPELDTAGRPSVFTQAQDSAEIKGLTLHVDPLELRRDLQRHIAALDSADQRLQAVARARRVRWLAVATVLLWLATLIVLLAHL